MEALNRRWRDNLGMQQKSRSRRAMLHILGFDHDKVSTFRIPDSTCAALSDPRSPSSSQYNVSYNLNSTAIFSELARKMEGEVSSKANERKTREARGSEST